jgi:hypothetical protein
MVGARSVTRSKFQAEEQQESDTTLQNSVARETWSMGHVHLLISE